ncbi:MAG: hypothetical protein WA140_02810 [Geobacteraceae bacterium]
MLRSGMVVLMTIVLMAQYVNVGGEQPKPPDTEGAVTQGEFASLDSLLLLPLVSRQGRK